MRFLTGCGVGLFAGYLLGRVVPLDIFLLACLILTALMILLFFLFHLGVRDFQE